MTLSCKSISKKYGSREILKDFSLKISPGEFHLLLGPSGSGKSTLMRLFSLLEPVDSGSIALGDVYFQHIPISNPKSWEVNKAYRQRVTMVFQQLFMWPHMTNLDGILKTAKLPVDTVMAYASRLKVDDCINRFPNEVSLGQRQRLAIIRALSTDADFYFFDEITSALDKEASVEVINIVTELCSANKSVVLVTHTPEMVAKSIDIEVKLTEFI